MWMFTDLIPHRNHVAGSPVFIALGVVTGVAATFAVVPLWKVKLLGSMEGANAVPRA